MARDLFETIVRPFGQLAALREHEGKLAPSPPVDNPVAGHLPAMKLNRLQFLLDSVREHGDVVRLRFGWLTAHVLAHPDHVRHVLVDNHRNYDKETPGFDRLRFLLGNGLLTSEGSFWKRQRQIANPAFHKDRIAAFAPVMVRAAEEAATAWKALSPTHLNDRAPTIDVTTEMMRLTLRVASLTLLSSDLSQEAGSVGQAVSLLLHEVTQRTIFPLSETLATWANPKLKKAKADLIAIVERTIAERRATASRDQNDVLALFMRARDEETGETMSDEQLRDEVMTMFLAGHETTANLLAWAFYLASKFPAAGAELRREVDEVVGDREITPDDVGKLVYHRRFLSETLRLYPPAWMIGRRARDTDIVGGFPIPRDSIVFLSPWVTHHHPAFFENPEGFDPDRFLPERFSEVPRHAYFPFGAGARICIGQGFALMEAVLLLATIVRRVRLDLRPGQNIYPEPTVTLRPNRAIEMSVVAR